MQHQHEEALTFDLRTRAATLSFVALLGLLVATAYAAKGLAQPRTALFGAALAQTE